MLNISSINKFISWRMKRDRYVFSMCVCVCVCVLVLVQGTGQVVYWYATITHIQQLQQTQTRTAHVMEQVTTELVREKEQIQLQSDTRTEELQHLRTEKEQLQTANTRSDEQICQLQQQVSNITVHDNIIVQVLFDSQLPSHRSNNNSSRQE